METQFAFHQIGLIWKELDQGTENTIASSEKIVCLHYLPLQFVPAGNISNSMFRKADCVLLQVQRYQTHKGRESFLSLRNAGKE